MIDDKRWQEAQTAEAEFWKSFTNTLVEEQKQLNYADKMGIYFDYVASIDFGNQSILDIGSNAISLMLRGNNIKRGVVLDPISIPQWAKDRYKTINVEYMQMKAEDMDFTENEFDEVWIYNCLQHVQDPEKIVKKALKAGKVLRIFEWLGEMHDPDDEKRDKLAKQLHPIILTKEDLNKWTGSEGRLGEFRLPLLKGTYYYDIIVK